jgi:hypothetical protein
LFRRCSAPRRSCSAPRATFWRGVASAREAVGGRDDGGPGGGVRASDQVVDIVPEHDELVIEARVSPQDIDTVYAGQEAYVMFPSFPQRSMHRRGRGPCLGRCLP